MWTRITKIGARIGIPLIAVACLVSPPAATTDRGPGGGQRRPLDLYDPDPNHIWNRVHRQVHVRVTPDGAEYGEDEVDPLLWHETKFLLIPPSRAAAIELLDEFLSSRAEGLVKDPLKRAVFQHDLWAVFDWVASRSDNNADARHALAVRLARIMRRVALTEREIQDLPDNYSRAVKARAFPERYDPRDTARAFLPPDLLDPRGAWLNVSGSFTQPIAAQHSGEISQSEFLVLLSAPDGQSATLDYLKALWDYPEAFLTDPFLDGEQRVSLNPKLPQLPSGTRAALVRRMLLIDSAGDIRRSNVTESVQLRVFHEPAAQPDTRGFHGDQDFFEFRMRRRDLFAGQSGGLHAVARDEAAPLTFSSHGLDLFERSEFASRGVGAPILEGCVNCHAERGIHSLRIARQLLKPQTRLDYRHPRWSVWASPAPEAKARRFDWGLLTGLWRSNSW